jgi:hypothetical protein
MNDFALYHGFNYYEITLKVSRYLQDSISVVETTKLVNPLNLFEFTKQPKRYFFFCMVR